MKEIQSISDAKSTEFIVSSDERIKILNANGKLKGFLDAEEKVFTFFTEGPAIRIFRAVAKSVGVEIEGKK